MRFKHTTINGKTGLIIADLTQLILYYEYDLIQSRPRYEMKGSQPPMADILVHLHCR